MNGNGSMMMVPVVVVVLAAEIYLGLRRHRRSAGEASQRRAQGDR